MAVSTLSAPCSAESGRTVLSLRLLWRLGA